MLSWIIVVVLSIVAVCVRTYAAITIFVVVVVVAAICS